MTETMTPQEFQAYAKGLTTGTRFKRYAGRKRKTATPESDVKTACIKMLWSLGCDVLSTPSGMAYRIVNEGKPDERRYPIHFGKKGLGDICAISPQGRWIECECKSEKGEQQPEQKRRQQQVERKGGVYILAYNHADVEARKADILAKDW
jgi:hypothetical protein